MGIKDPYSLVLPMPISTERLLIRPIVPGDGKAVFEAVDESREQFKHWLPWVDTALTWEDSEEMAVEFYADFTNRKTINLVIFNHQHLVGMCGLQEINWRTPSAALGYWCRAGEQGKGYIREAVAALTKYAFNVIGFKRIVIACNDDNIKSIKIAEDLNFALETRAKGIVENINGDELVIGRVYVRFDCSGLQ